MIQRRELSSQSVERRLAKQVLGELPGRVANWNEELARISGLVQRGRHLDGDRERILARLAEIEVQLSAERARLDEQIAALDGAARNGRVNDVQQAMSRVLAMVAEARAVLASA